jgi:hypothetical protein
VVIAITPATRLLLAHAHSDIANVARVPVRAVLPVPRRRSPHCRVWGHVRQAVGEEPLEAAQHRRALFASLPIPQIEVVTDHLTRSHLRTVDKASRAGVPVVEVEQ